MANDFLKIQLVLTMYDLSKKTLASVAVPRWGGGQLRVF